MAGLGKGIIKDLVGKRFGKLLVISLADPSKSKRSGVNYIKWLCKCDCGTQLSITSKQLYRGQVSCGCHKLIGSFRYFSNTEETKDIHTGRFIRRAFDVDININKLISRYRSKVKSGKKETKIWALTYDEAKRLFFGDCFYCGAAPQTIMQAYKDITPTLVNGIDRLDSTAGYISTNVVSCCKICNTAKMALSVDEFLSHINKIARFNKMV